MMIKNNHVIFSRCTAALCILGALGVVVVVSAPQNVPPEILLKNRSFKLVTEILFTFERTSAQFEVEEIYSNWQRRTLVHVRTIKSGGGKSKDGSDSNQKAKALNDQTTNQTTSSSESNFYADSQQVLLFGQDLRLYGYRPVNVDFTNEFFHSSLLGELPTGSPPLIGPAKFLYHAMEDRQSFALLPEDSAWKIPGMLIYKSKLVPEPQRVDYSLVYSSDPYKNHANGVPAMLIVHAEQSKNLNIVYKFKSFHLLPDEPIYGPTSNWLISSSGSHDSSFVDATESILYDAFALGRIVGYGKLVKLDSSSSSSLLSKDYRFSFKAQVDSFGSNEMIHLSVGYEPSIKVLRVNRQTRTRQTELLINYHTRQAYSVIKRLNSLYDILLDTLIQIRRTDQEQDLSCLVTPVEVPKSSRAPSPLTRNPFSLGQMLFGSEEFVYIGVARVRGIEVRVFEAFDCAWPVWFQQPVDGGRSQEGGELYRNEGGGPDEIVLNILVYVTYDPSSQTAGGADLFSGGQPLMMEISRVQKRIKRVIGRIRIELFEFSRELSAASADDSRLERFFTLDESCTAQQPHYGQVELMLLRDWPHDDTQSLRWLRNSVARNLALMRALQEKLGVSSNLIYDLDSQFVRSSTRGANVNMEEFISVPATLRLMEHSHATVNLIYLGEGTSRVELASRRMFVTEHFQTCYLVAAHTKQDSVIFAYSIETNLCIIYPQNIEPKDTFDFESKRKVIRVYQVKHNSSGARRQQGEDAILLLSNSKHRLSSLQKLSLVNPSDASSAPFEIALKSVKVEELDESIDHNKFTGLGLVPVGELNRRVEPSLDELSSSELAHLSGMASEMSAARCQSACLADLDCNSYSLCVHNSRLECVVSSVDFRQPHLLTVLSVLMNKQDVKLGQQFSVALEKDENAGAASVQVKRHPACELHNKIYKDLFEVIPRKEQVNLFHRRFHPVEDHEQCAELCVKQTQRVMRDEVQLLHNISRQVLNDPESKPEAIQKAHSDYKKINSLACSAYMYLDRFDFMQFNERAQRQIEARMVSDTDDDERTNGYCVIGEIESKPLEIHEPDTWLEIPVTRANFDFSFMYDQLQDVALVATPMGKDESKAYRRITGRAPAGLKATKSHYQTLREFIDEGENISESYDSVLSYSEAVAFCARLCFAEAWNLWPACKSFDVLEVKVDDETRERRTHCFFNSITLSDAIKNQKEHLITRSLRDQKRLKEAQVLRVVHFEPKANLIDDAVSLLELDESQLEASDEDDKLAVQNMHPFGLFCLLLVALAVGVVAGVKLVAPKVLPRLRSIVGTTREELLPDDVNLGDADQLPK